MVSSSLCCIRSPAELSTSDVAFMLFSVLRDHTNIDAKVEEVTAVSLKARTVTTSQGRTYRTESAVSDHTEAVRADLRYKAGTMDVL
jgi:NADH dehydrogenase FAD-containing subunit